MGPLEAGKAPRGRVWLAFAAVYVIWGTTYLAIAYVIDTLPSLLAMGLRYIVAGAALWMIAPGSWRTRPTRQDWTWAFALGGLLLLAGNGIVAIVQGKMPSGVTALIITVVPLWMVLVEWATGGGRPKPLPVLGILLGFAGVALLAGESGGWEGGEVDPWYVAALLFGTLCWAIGSILSRRGGIKLPLLRSVALQMMAGSILLCAASGLRGEWSGLHVDRVSMASLAAWAYLVTFGSIVAFSAYTWLLTVRPSAVVSTYAFVNPVVAVALGALVLDEPVGPQTLLASALIVGAVALVVYSKARADRAKANAERPAPAPAK
jgi:drug/metabolite transporter (DMT)-like permease